MSKPRPRKKSKNRRNAYTVMDASQLQRPARLCRRLDHDATERASGFRTIAAARRQRAIATYQEGFSAVQEREAARAQRTIRIERRDRGA